MKKKFGISCGLDKVKKIENELNSRKIKFEKTRFNRKNISYTFYSLESEAEKIAKIVNS